MPQPPPAEPTQAPLPSDAGSQGPSRPPPPAGEPQPVQPTASQGQASEKLTLFGKEIGVVSDATRATWMQRLSNDPTVQRLVELKSKSYLSEESFDLLIRKYQDGNQSTASLDGQIKKGDLNFVAESIEGMRTTLTEPAKVRDRVDQALFLGGVASLRRLKQDNKLSAPDAEGVTDVDVTRAKSVLKAFSGDRQAIQGLQSAGGRSMPEGGHSKPGGQSQSNPPGRPSPEAPQTPADGSVQRSSLTPSSPGAPRMTGASMALVPTDRRNALGNPMYSLQLFDNGRLVRQFDAVSGRANTQNRDRLTSGTESPLPDGEYTIGEPVKGENPEIGKTRDGNRWFIPTKLATLEQTGGQRQSGRSALGIHLDTSFGKRNGEDGTEGCVGLTNNEDW